jgi:hypothetical protein
MTDEELAKELGGAQFSQVRVDEWTHMLTIDFDRAIDHHTHQRTVSLVQVSPEGRVYSGAPQQWVIDENNRSLLQLPQNAADVLPTYPTLREAKIAAMRFLVLKDTEIRLAGVRGTRGAG